MKKIIRLTETQLTELISRVIKEQSQPESYYRSEAERLLRQGPQPTEPGAKYCFTKDDLIKDIKIEGADYIKLYKIKKGDSLSKLKSMTDQHYALIKNNYRCKLNEKDGVKTNDIVALSLRPSH